MSEQVKISTIKDELERARIDELDQFITKHQVDERASVISLVAKARKRQLDYEKELDRLEKMRYFEKKYSEYEYICGIDEVGRGPLAGPVVTGAVILPKDCVILYLNDSKRLSEKRREELNEIILDKAVAYGYGLNSPERIDEINILNATLEAMRNSVLSLKPTPDLLLNDAVTIPGLDIKQVGIVKGDAKSVSIAAASIIAKVKRDRMMVEYDKLYPEYGFSSNKGYGSKEHIEAIKKYGPTSIHRRSFIGNFI